VIRKFAEAIIEAQEKEMAFLRRCWRARESHRAKRPPSRFLVDLSRQLGAWLASLADGGAVHREREQCNAF
jgi:hypothetical protein